MTRNELLRAIDLLRKVVYAPDSTVLFSGRSLQVLLDHLENDLKRVPDGREAIVLRHWEQNMPGFQEQLFAQAERATLFAGHGQIDQFRGTQVVRVTENATVMALGFCPPAPKLP